MNKHDIRALDDDCYPLVTVFDDGPMPTPEQMKALFRKWEQDDQGLTWVEFAHTVQPTSHMNGAITVKWCNMWLAIETEGMCHS